ncbi:MAG: phage-related protein tail component [Fibrobacteres bacterium]|nr:phage-related protein tail component [Fibrobacterota bacterium]
MDPGSLFQRKKRKLYVAYDHVRDASKYSAFEDLFSSLFNIVRDNSLERELDTGDAESYLRNLREGAMADCDCVIVLCGAETHSLKFVDWEIKAALDLKLGLIGVILPDNPGGTRGDPVLPDRLRRNFDAGFAVVCRADELAQGRIDLAPRIVFAQDQPVSRIDNTQPLRDRDG